MTERNAKIMAYAHGELSAAEQQALRLTTEEKARVEEIRAMDSMLHAALKREPMEGLSPTQLAGLLAKLDAPPTRKSEHPIRKKSERGYWRWLGLRGMPLLGAAAALGIYIYTKDSHSNKSGSADFAETVSVPALRSGREPTTSNEGSTQTLKKGQALDSQMASAGAPAPAASAPTSAKSKSAKGQVLGEGTVTKTVVKTIRAVGYAKLAIDKHMEQITPQLNGCRKISGPSQITFVVMPEPSGEVSMVKILSSKNSDETTLDCVTKSLKSVKFPQSVAKTRRVEATLAWE